MGRQIPITALTKLISADDFRKLVGVVGSERDKIAILLLSGTGMRVEELVASKLEDVDTIEGIIHIHAARTKTQQCRDVVVLESMIPDLKRWIESLPEGSIWLFPGRDPSKHISQRWIRMVIDKAGRPFCWYPETVCDIQNGRPMNIVSPHTLRHLHAVAALDSGVPLNDLQAQLGHTDLKTTSVYLKSDINHRRKSYEGFGI